MDEVLYQFNGEYFICSKITIDSFDTDAFAIEATLLIQFVSFIFLSLISSRFRHGETFDLEKHPQGTEIKAMTYSNMQIHDKPQEGKADVYVIVDI